jgi:indolepyruvate ferredoxin oxidoreductase beta subunit
MSDFNTVLAGTGGQGILLASKIMVQAALHQGLAVLGAETHGMAQRGGSVVAHVRTGECHSPMVLPRSAHLLVALEQLEGLRNLAFLRPGGLFIANSPDDSFITPEVRQYLERQQAEVVTLDATALAVAGGSVRNVNVVLLGGCAAHPRTPFDLEQLRTAVEAMVRPKFVEPCMAALKQGHDAAAGSH